MPLGQESERAGIVYRPLFWLVRWDDVALLLIPRSDYGWAADITLGAVSGDGKKHQKCRHDFWRSKMVTANDAIFAVTLSCRSLRTMFLPLFSGVVSLAPRWRSWRSISFGRSFSCQDNQSKKEADYIRNLTSGPISRPAGNIFRFTYVTG